MQDASNPGSPNSSKVGTSGSSENRFLLVTATARNLPAWILPSAGGSTPNAIGTCPPSRSFITGAVPL